MVFLLPSNLVAGAFNQSTGKLACIFKKMLLLLITQENVLNAGCTVHLLHSCSTMHKDLRFIRADIESTSSVMTLNNLVVKTFTWIKQIPSFYSLSQNWIDIFLDLHAKKCLKAISGYETFLWHEICEFGTTKMIT